MSNRTKLTDLLGPISIEIEREEERVFKLPKPSTIIKSGLAMGINKINDINLRSKDICGQIDQTNEDKLVQNVLEESNVISLNEEIIGLEDVLREYKN